MDPAIRLVTRLPVTELWNSTGTLAAVKRRCLDGDDIAEALRQGRVRFVVANVGKPLRWVPDSDCHTFWKTEIKPRVVPPDISEFRPQDFPGEYCYRASEWADGEAPAIVLLEMYH